MIYDTPWMPALVPTATASAATAAEAAAGLDATKYVSPAALASANAILANPRAPAQALVFDGTAGATITSIAGFGTGDFTLAARVNFADTGTSRGIFGGIAGPGLALYRDSTGNLVAEANATASMAVMTAFSWVANTVYALACVRSAGAITFYINGVAQTNASAANPAYNLTDPMTVLGALRSGVSVMSGTIAAPFVFNRALSAAEVLALYQQGAPAVADFHAGLVNTTISAGSFVVGRRYRILVVGTTSFTGIGASANTIGVEFIATGVGTGTGTATAIGLLAAPCAQQPGAGLQWLDCSSQRAHLTLPTSGVRFLLQNVSQQIVVEATVTHTAGTNVQLGGGSLIDTARQWRIVSISANSTAITTITLGNVSAGAQHVASVALAVGNNALTIVAGVGGNFLSTANLWSNSSAIATIRYTLVLAPA